MITTTLKKIRQHRPCGLKRGSNKGYDLLRKNLGKDYGGDTPIKFSQIVESNGSDDAIWCLCSVCPEHEEEVRLLAAKYAESVLHLFEDKYPEDKRPRQAIQAARDFANGLINKEQLWAAKAAAWDAAWDADMDAAKVAAWDAAKVAAWAAAGDTWAAAGDAKAAAGDAAWAAKAAWAAAGDAKAAWAAAWDAERDAGDAEREKQIRMLIDMFG